MTSVLRLGLASAVALALVGCGESEEPLEHGFVKIQVVRADNESSTPFVGTAQVFIALEYETCLQNFYEANPNYAQSGADGSLVFGTMADGGEGWRDRLCDGDGIDQPADCDVISIEQELDNSKQLRVTYQINNDVLDRRVFKVGPIPTADLAMCDGGLPPTVRLVAPTPVQGYNAQGDKIWETSSFVNAQGKPGQGAELVVKISRTQ
jgi:hypothetical protein